MHSRKEGWFHSSYANLIGTKKVQIPQDWFGSPTWPPFHFCGTPIWRTWSHLNVMWYFPRAISYLLYSSARQQLDAWTVYLSAQHFVISQVVSVLCFLSIIHQPITPNYNSLGMCFVKHLQHAFYQALQFPHFLAHKFFRRVES